MLNKEAWADIQGVIRDPGFRIIQERLAAIREKADRDFHASFDHESFLRNKGRYDMIHTICEMFFEPKGLVDDGVQTMTFSQERNGGIVHHHAKE